MPLRLVTKVALFRVTNVTSVGRACRAVSALCCPRAAGRSGEDRAARRGKGPGAGLFGSGGLSLGAGDRVERGGEFGLGGHRLPCCLGQGGVGVVGYR